MLALQFERGKIVIELRRCPAIDGMTRRTIQPKAALMRLIVVVAGKAILWRRREINPPARVEMALHASNTSMRAGELERKNAVIEIFIEAVYAIMTIEAGGAEGQAMGGHEPEVHLTVACVTGFWSKSCDIAVVAVITGKRLTGGHQLVSA